MMTPTGSVKGTGAVDSVKSTQVRQPSQRTVPRRASRSVGPTQSFFMREAKPLGAVQIMNGLIHIALGGILMVPLGVYAPICITIWYPLWGGIMFIISGSLLVAAENSPSNILAKAKVGMNVISLFSAITGIIILIMDVFNITISHFFKMESLYLAKTSMPYINIYSCEQSGISQQYCLGMRAAFLVSARLVRIRWFPGHPGITSWEEDPRLIWTALLFGCLGHRRRSSVAQGMEHGPGSQKDRGPAPRSATLPGELGQVTSLL
uniref:Membrane spanning 4-domains A1 n=1 Tax=Ornithorhynchus anatinus TaxID=9258 RepID=A0A6I8NJ96_ORNAN